MAQPRGATGPVSLEGIVAVLSEHGTARLSRGTRRTSARRPVVTRTSSVGVPGIDQQDRSTYLFKSPYGTNLRPSPLHVVSPCARPSRHSGDASAADERGADEVATEPIRGGIQHVIPQQSPDGPVLRGVNEETL